MKQKITLLGNCQTKALSWYIKQIDLSFDVQWVCLEIFVEGWGPRPRLYGQKVYPITKVITDPCKAIQRLKSSDVIIYQIINEKTSKHYNQEKLSSYINPNCRAISISSFYYLPKHPNGELFKGMVERAKKFNIDIPAHKIIEKHRSKIKVKMLHHPKVFYFLELVREICKLTGWNYYSEEKYTELFKKGYPFG